MKLFGVFLLTFTGFALAVPIDDTASDDKPRGTEVKIKGVRWNGSGCPYNGVQSIVNGDATILTLLFNNYTASIGPGVNRADARKNCQVSLELTYPTGYQYSVADVTLRGYIDIDDGIIATVQSRYYFQGQSGGRDAVGKHDIRGPFHNNFAKTDSVPVESLVWSPCGAVAAAQINNDIRLVSEKPNAGGAATVDSLDAKFTQKHYFDYRLHWRKSSCSSGRGRITNNEIFDMQIEESTVTLDY